MFYIENILILLDNFINITIFKFNLDKKIKYSFDI